MSDVPKWLKDLSTEKQAQLKDWLDSELQSMSRRDMLKAMGAVGGGAAVGGAGVGALSQSAKAADTGVAQVGEAGNPTDVVLDQIKDTGGDLVADLDDTGDMDWQGRGFDNLGSVATEGLKHKSGVAALRTPTEHQRRRWHPGQLYDNFESGAIGTEYVETGTGSLSFDTSIYYQGSKSLKIVATGGSNNGVQIDSKQNYDLTGRDLCFAARTDSPANCKIRIRIYSNNFSNYVQGESKLDGPEDPTWIRLGVGYNLESGTFDPTDVDHVNIQILNQSSSSDVTLWIDDLREVPKRDRGAVILSFDDGFQSFYDTAIPKLENYGYSAVNAVIKDKIGTSGYMDWPQLQEARNEGHEIVVHGDSTPDYREEIINNGKDSLRDRLDDRRRYLIDNGIDLGSQFAIYPGSQQNADVHDVVSEFFALAGGVSGHASMITVPNGTDPFGFPRHVGDGLSDAQTAVQGAAAHNQLVIISLHDFGDSLTMSASDFDSLLSTIDSEGVDVLTYADWWQDHPYNRGTS